MGEFGTGTDTREPPITKANDGTWSFVFPAKESRIDVNYVYSKPASLAVGPTITLTFSVRDDALEDARDYQGFEAAIIADYDAQSTVERELVLR